MTSLGGKTTLGTSAVSKAAVEALRVLREGVASIMPINTPEKALAYRRLLVADNPAIGARFRELGLAF